MRHESLIGTPSAVVMFCVFLLLFNLCEQMEVVVSGLPLIKHLSPV